MRVRPDRAPSPRPRPKQCAYEPTSSGFCSFFQKFFMKIFMDQTRNFQFCSFVLSFFFHKHSSKHTLFLRILNIPNHCLTNLFRDSWHLCWCSFIKTIFFFSDLSAPRTVILARATSLRWQTLPDMACCLIITLPWCMTTGFAWDSYPAWDSVHDTG